jgi:hypothetical protein
MADKPQSKKTITAVTRRFDGDISFDSDLFKLGAASMLRNTSFIKYKPSLLEMEHSHIYRSVHDKNGQPNKYSAPTGGHFHEVKTEWADDGNGNAVLVRAECGPPIEKVKRKLRSGNIETTVEQVAFQTEREDQPILDNHTHEVIYVKTQTVNESARQKSIDQDRQKVVHLTKGAVPNTKTLPTAAPEMVEA